MGGRASRVRVHPPASSSPIPAPPRKTFAGNKFSHIADNYETLDQVQNSLRHAGLESSNLILGIDFTKSNEWTGKQSFHGQSLHAIGNQLNPYQQAISIIGQTLAAFDEDNLIPCFGFGDASTHDQQVFSFYQDHHPCQGFDDALARYRQMAPNLALSGPTSFAPVIDAAVTTVQESGGQYHVLVIIADGQVTRSVDTSRGSFSPQEKATIDAIVRASDYPLSIVLVGVGDGPWDTMRAFDDNIPARDFDNFQFVNFSAIMGQHSTLPHKQAMFALAALMEIPSQYKAAMEFNLLGKTGGRTLQRKPLPPPPAVLQADLQAGGFGGNFQMGSHASPAAGSYQQQRYPPAQFSTHGMPDHAQPQVDLPHVYPPQSNNGHFNGHFNGHSIASRDINDSEQACPVCMSKRRDMAFGCGHQTCRDCGKNLRSCPICREKISTRIRLYS